MLPDPPDRMPAGAGLQASAGQLRVRIVGGAIQVWRPELEAFRKRREARDREQLARLTRVAPRLAPGLLGGGLGLVQKGEEIHRIAWPGVHSYNTTFSPDGRHFLVGGDGSALRLYEVKSGKLLRELTGHTHWTQHAVFLPDGKQALSASMDGTLRLWNLTTGKEVRRLNGHAGGACSVDVSPDGKWAVSAGADRTLRLWDVAKGKEVRTFKGHTDSCTALFTPDGKQILSSGYDRTMRLWDVASGKEVRKFEGHTAALYGAFALPDGKRALSYSADATARVWNLATGKEEKKLDLGAKLTDIRGVALSPDGKHILVGTDGPYMVRLLELASGKEVHRFTCLTSPRGLSFSRDGRLAAGGSMRGLVYLWRVPKTVADYSRAIDLNPKDATAWYGRGFAYDKLAQWDKAVADYSRAIELAPKYKDAWYNRGIAYRRLGHWDKALDDFSRAIDLDPKFALAWGNRGLAYLDAGQLDNAVADFSRVIELAPKLAPAWYNRGYAYLRLGQHAKAVADYSRAIELDPKDAPAWYNRGYAYLNLGQHAKAVADFSRAIELDPKDAGDHNTLAWLLATCPDVKLRDPHQAVKLAKKAVQLEPKEGIYWKTLGVAHYRAGDWKAAVAALDKSSDLKKGGDACTWLFLAVAHHKLGNHDEARKRYDQAVEWMNKNRAALGKDRTQAEELRRFRSEAEEVLQTLPPPRAEAPRAKPAPAVGGPAPPEALLLVGHKGAVHAVAFAPDGKAVATAGADGTVRVWDPATGRQIQKLTQRGKVVGVAVSPDATRIAAVSASGVTRGPDPWRREGRTVDGIVWDARTGKQLLRMAGGMPGERAAVAFSPDGKTVALSFQGGSTWLLKMNLALPLPIFNNAPDSGTAVAFSPDGKTLMVGGRTCQLLDATTGRPLRRWAGKGTVTALAFRRDGTRVAAADGGKAVRLLNPSNGMEETAFAGKEAVGALAFSADGKRVATAGADGVVLLWDAAGKQERLFHAGGAVNAVAFSPDGLRLATAGEHGAMVWDLMRGEKPPPVGLKLTEKQLGSLWTDLASGEGGKVYAASRLLRADPARSVPFLRQHLEPKEAGPDKKRLTQLIAELDGDEFAKREAAAKALAKLGAAAESALRQALAARPSPEARMRLERLLKALGRGKALTATQQRDVWAVRVLEQIGTTEARKVLQALRKKSPDWWIAQEAKEALLRLARRDSKP
jgi:WD40 repeat protein/Flp pilus assembly protein TadD